MRVALYDKASASLLFEKSNCLNDLDLGGYVKEDNSYVNHFHTKGVYKEIFLEGVHIGFGDLRAKKQNDFLYISNIENIEMHFNLKGWSKAFTNCKERKLLFDFQPNSHNILYSKKVNSIYRHIDSEFCFFEIKFTPSIFLKYLDSNSYLAQEFYRAISKESFASYSLCNYPITLEMLEVIKQIINCQRQGVFKQMFLKSKIIQLLLLQLEQFNSPQVPRLGSAEVQRAVYLKSFMDDNLDLRVDLKQLASMVNTNENNIKKVFKQVYNSTIFAYWHVVRMQRAKTMLESLESNINEVSILVGYKNARHFSSAFKKHYGYSPSCLLKKI